MSGEDWCGDKGLECRLTLMRELAASLEQAQRAVLQSDAKELQSQTARQRILLGELAETAAVRPPGQPAGKPHSAVAPWTAGRRTGLEKEWAELEMRVAHLNLSYAALLRRARRTVDIFCRLLASSSITYVPPGYETAVASHDGMR